MTHALSESRRHRAGRILHRPVQARGRSSAAFSPAPLESLKLSGPSKLTRQNRLTCPSQGRLVMEKTSADGPGQLLQLWSQVKNAGLRGLADSNDREDRRCEPFSSTQRPHWPQVSLGSIGSDLKYLTIHNDNCRINSHNLHAQAWPRSARVSCASTTGLRPRTAAWAARSSSAAR